MKVQVLIVGTMQCCICSGDMTQADVNKQEAILSTSESLLPFVGIIAHTKHFYDNELKCHPADYELNLRKFAFAIAQRRGEMTIEMMQKAKAEIQQMEFEFHQKHVAS